MMTQMNDCQGPPVILVSNSGQLQPYTLSVKKNHLLIIPDAGGSKNIVYDLQKIHMVSLDLKAEKINSSSNKKYFQAILRNGKQFRSLVLSSLEGMHDAMNFILTNQKLQPQRSYQYRFLNKFDLHCLTGEGSVVEHRLTKEKFVRKTILKTSDAAYQIKLVRNEVDFLKACRSQKGVVKLVDVIEDSQYISMIFKYFEQQSLRDMVDHGVVKDQNDVIQIFSDIAKIVKSLHKAGIVHRNLDLD